MSFKCWQSIKNLKAINKKLCGDHRRSGRNDSQKDYFALSRRTEKLTEETVKSKYRLEFSNTNQLMSVS